MSVTVHHDFRKLFPALGKQAEILSTFDSWQALALGDSSLVVHQNPELPPGTSLFGFERLGRDLDEVAALLARAEELARAAGATALAGPVSFATWLGYKWKASGFEHALPPEPQNGPELPALVERLGFSPRHRYTSALIDLTDDAYHARLAQADRRCCEAGLTMRHHRGAEWRGALDAIFELTNASFGHLPFFCPIRRDYFEEVYLDFLLGVETRVDVAFEGTRAVGFAISYPNPRSPGWWILPLVAVAADQRRTGLGSALLYRAHGAARERRATGFLHHHMHESSNLRHLTRGHRTLATYAVYEKELR